FTLEIIKNDLIDAGIPTENLKLIKPHRKIKFGKNSIFPISLTHSVPDTVGYVLYTESGTIFYTGNFIFDPTMTGSYKTDIGKLAYVGKQGVLCLLTESLYADKRGFTSPNHRVSSIIRETLSKNEGRIFFNTFQNHLYRIQELLTEINQTNRKIVIMGKHLEKTIIKAIDMKYIDFDKSKIATIQHVNDDNVVILISDEREKPYSNIGRIVRGFDKFVKITEDDTVLFAAPVYDGLEKSATKIFDDISKIGANLVLLPTNKYLEHNASSEDLMLMLDLIKPKYYFPVIGEYRHQVENAKIAIKAGIPEKNVLLKLNGQVVEFENGKLLDTNEKVKVDDILIDGKNAGDIGEIVLKDRESLSENGVVIVTATLSKTTKKIIAGPEILTRGFIFVKENIDLIKEAEKYSLEVINENIKNKQVDFNNVKMGIRDKLGKFLYKETGCQPMILVVLQEI
ncbi:MAG: ribonuclease J, partial [Mollicutes bacterium]|nr:ribonuclease J [Mollicutes bacterium]